MPSRTLRAFFRKPPQIVSSFCSWPLRTAPVNSFIRKLHEAKAASKPPSIASL